MGNMVTVAAFRDLLEAEIVKGRLEAEGIMCALGDEHLVSVNPLYSNAVGGVKLLIREEDFEKAASILAENIERNDYPGGEQINVADVGDIAHHKLSALLQTKSGTALFVTLVILAATGVYVVYYFMAKTL